MLLYLGITLQDIKFKERDIYTHTYYEEKNINIYKIVIMFYD